MDEFHDYGPRLQVKMFEVVREPDAAAVEDFAVSAANLFGWDSPGV